MEDVLRKESKVSTSKGREEWEEETHRWALVPARVVVQV